MKKTNFFLGVFLYILLTYNLVFAATEPRVHDLRLSRVAVSLFSERIEDFDDALKEEAKSLLATPTTSAHYLTRTEILEKNGCMYVEINKPDPPVWAEIFRAYLTENGSEVITPGKIKKEKSGIILIKEPTSKRIFAFIFGDGRYLLKKDLREERFGVRVTFNTLAAETASMVSAFSHYRPSNNPYSKSMRYAKGIGADTAVHESGSILTALTIPSHKGPHKRFVAQTVYWPFNLTPESIPKLPELCTQLYGYFTSDKYKQKFGFIDHFNKVDSEKKKVLDKRLLARVNAGQSGWYFAKPDLFDSEHDDRMDVNYSLEGSRVFDSLDDLFNEVSRDRQKGITLNSLRRKVQIKGQDDGVLEEWCLYDALVFETEQTDGYYVLNSGQWFKIDKSFVENINAVINSCFVTDSPGKETDRLLQKRLTPVTEQDQRQAAAARKTAKDRKTPPGSLSADAEAASVTTKSAEEEKGCYLEDIYNQRVAKESQGDLLLMDRRLVYFSRGDRVENSRGGIEVGDLLSTAKHIIHVKDWTRSSTFSHLCAQGSVSADLLKKDPSTRSKAKEKYLKEEAKLRSSERDEGLAKKFDSILPPETEPFNPGDYTVVYAFFHTKSHLKLSSYLPLFSRITLNDAILKLREEGFNVAVKRILKQVLLTPLSKPARSSLKRPLPTSSVPAASSSPEEATPTGITSGIMAPLTHSEEPDNLEDDDETVPEKPQQARKKSRDIRSYLFDPTIEKLKRTIPSAFDVPDADFPCFEVGPGIIPPTHPQTLVSGLALGDGNCFFHSIITRDGEGYDSVTGRAQEMRRVAVDAVMREASYQHIMKKELLVVKRLLAGRIDGIGDEELREVSEADISGVSEDELRAYLDNYLDQSRGPAYYIRFPNQAELRMTFANIIAEINDFKVIVLGISAAPTQKKLTFISRLGNDGASNLYYIMLRGNHVVPLLNYPLQGDDRLKSILQAKRNYDVWNGG